MTHKKKKRPSDMNIICLNGLDKDIQRVSRIFIVDGSLTNVY